jgi:DNA-binding MarR family transcriptional regulator
MASALGGLALMQRYSLNVSRVADRTLTQGGAPNLDIQLLTTIHRLGGASPSDVAASVGRPRSTVSRSIARAMDQGLIERFTDTRDRRRADLRLTALGLERVEAFADAMAEAFLEHAPLVRDIALLLGREADDSSQRQAGSTLDLAGLLSAAGARFGREVAPVMWRYRLTGPVDRYALVLVAHRGQVRPAQLASELMLTPAGTSSLLERLEARRLIVRESGTVVGDGRGVLVRLTPTGSEAVAAVVRVFLRHQDALVDALTQTLTVRSTAAA